jgi:hypothetical protein
VRDLGFNLGFDLGFDLRFNLGLNLSCRFLLLDLDLRFLKCEKIVTDCYTKKSANHKFWVLVYLFTIGAMNRKWIGQKINPSNNSGKHKRVNTGRWINTPVERFQSFVLIFVPP